MSPRREELFASHVASMEMIWAGLLWPPDEAQARKMRKPLLTSHHSLYGRV